MSWLMAIGLIGGRGRGSGGSKTRSCAILVFRPPYWHNTRMFFRATILRLFPVACATVMLCASAVE
jgi:hypothetical protein